jgi:hypothetical protein
VEVLGLLDERPVGQLDHRQQLGRERRGRGGQKARERAQFHTLHHVEAGEGAGRQVEQNCEQGIGQLRGLGKRALAHGHHGQQLRAGELVPFRGQPAAVPAKLRIEHEG